MEDLNHVLIMGRLTNDATMGNVANISKLDFCVAYNTTKKNGNNYEDEVNFLNLSLWGKIAESLEKRMLKGVQVIVEGHLKQNRWTNQEGKQQSKLEVIVDKIKVISSGSSKKNVENNGNDASMYEDASFPF